jgi:uncharacterized protein
MSQELNPMHHLPLISSVVFIIFVMMARFGKGGSRTLGYILAGVLGLVMSIGIIKGFDRLVYGHLNINSAKLVIALGLAILLPAPLRWTRSASGWLLAGLIALPVMAILLDVKHFNPTLKLAILWFALNNVITVLAEDFYFRRFVQDHLKGLGTPIEVLLTGALFGLVHFKGGPMFMLVAAVAGVIYSATYRSSGNSVWAVSVVHLSVNVLGYVLFGKP